MSLRMRAVGLALLERLHDDGDHGIAGRGAGVLGGVALGLVRVEAAAGVEAIGLFLLKLDIRAADRLHLVDSRLVCRDRGDEALAQLDERALGDRVQQVVLVAEVNVEEGAREARAPGDAVHGDGVPADLRVQLFGRVDHFGATALFFFFAADRYIRHPGTLTRSLTRCQ